MNSIRTFLFSGLWVFALSAGFNASAVDSPQHVQSIKGCFHVTYRYVGDGKHDYDLKDLKGKPIVEWVSTKKGTDLASNTLQHWGVYWDKDKNQYEAMKHWSESWQELPTGEWKQTVFSPFGKVRYVCQGKFHFNQLRCSAANAPKPTRDSKRTDYDVLDRENALQFTSAGWVQNENNVKKKLDGTEVSIEVGWIEYRRVDESECEVGKKAEAEQP